MAVAVESPFRRSIVQQPTNMAVTLEDKYEVVKEIGDGSFGSVVLGRTRSAGAVTVRRNTMVAIKTMKKTYDSFAQCLELREVVFLRTLPSHHHLIPAYDIFLDPLSRKLHISMEYMDGNLYQLMKAREHKQFDGASVKSILYQILSGLEHIHEHGFFHRDIKPENVLVSSSSPETGNAFKRYSAIMTPPSTPPTYSVKLADFGLARECNSKTPYTTYVSTRWYRAPEVLLRAGEYGAPVDIWALGAMAVEIATLKPLFPGANEVDQVWRVCEIMGSPGLWVNKKGVRQGGGEWKEGIKLAQKLGFSFPKMAPHLLSSIIPSPQWPASLAEFVNWCLLWDPTARPTSTQALAHSYFTDAIDPLRPKSSASSRLLGRRQSSLQDSPTSPHSLATKTSSWFRRSLVGQKDLTPVEPMATLQPLTKRPSVAQLPPDIPAVTTRPKPTLAKKPSLKISPLTNAAPIPILPSIRPVSPVSDATPANASKPTDHLERPGKKLGRQLSVNSSTNHYADYHRHEAEKALTGGSGLSSPVATATKEGFFSHLRKRARRFSGRYPISASPSGDEIEPETYGPNNAAPSYRNSVVMDQNPSEADPNSPSKDSGYADLDTILNNVRYSLERGKALPDLPPKQPQRIPSFNSIRRLGSFYRNPNQQIESSVHVEHSRRSTRKNLRTDRHYETPDEEDEILNDALASAKQLAMEIDASSGVQSNAKTLAHSASASSLGPYLTPSPSKENTAPMSGIVDTIGLSKPLDIKKRPQQASLHPRWPTPPYEDNDWASTAAASIFAAQAHHR